MKAKDIITFAFAEVVQSKYKIEPVNLVDGLRYLNRMMAKYNAEGIELGYGKELGINPMATIQHRPS